MSNVDDKINEKYEEARNIAVEEMIRISRKILKEHRKYDECYIAMGSIFFTVKDNKNYLTNTVNLYLCYGQKAQLTFEYFKPLADLISKWDDVLKLTGEGIKFRAEGEIITDW